MARQPFRTVWWAQARDCEALHGRAFAEATWGTGYYREDTSPLKGEDFTARVEAMERQVNFLYANLAMKAAKEDKVIWKPSDGLAAREM